MIISLAAQSHWKIYQIDVKSAFLNGLLEEEAYVEQPPGYVKQRAEDKVYRLKKGFIWSETSIKGWYTRIDSYFLNNEFQKHPYEHTLYMKVNKDGDIVIVCLYVDDLIFIGNNLKLISEFKEVMITQFEITDLGLMS